MIALLLTACTPAPAILGTAPALNLTVSPQTPMVPVITWPADQGSLDISGPNTSFTTSGTPSAGIPIFRLIPDTTYTLTASDPALTPLDFTTPPLPDALSRSSVTAQDPASTLGDGGVMMALAAEFSSFVAVADAAGNWVWWTETDLGLTAASPRVTLDGSGIWFAQHERTREQDLGIATRLSWDGRVREDRRTVGGHHMTAELPDGQLAFLAYRAEPAILEGETRDVLSDTIDVTDGSTTETRFSFFDLTDPFIPCSHAAVPRTKFGFEGVYEWTHANSLVHDADAGLFYVMSWHLNALLAVDEDSGALVWQLGGRDATRSFANEDDAFQHAHTSWVEEDVAWVFDNQVHAGTTSRLMQYDLSQDPVVATTRILEAKGRNVGFLGDVQAAPDGHALGAWTVPGDVTEHGATGRELWRFSVGPGTVLGRIRYVELPR